MLHFQLHHVTRTTVVLLTLCVALVVVLPGAASFLIITPQIHVGYSQRTVSYATTPLHPAVEGWPEKYSGSVEEEEQRGPRVLHDTFCVEKATEYQKYQLDVSNWPTWSTANNPKWVVGKQNVDKVMPYGELSYVLSGQLEVIPTEDGQQEAAVIVEAGDFVTFPQGFTSSWRVLEELTWHYYLY